MIPVLFAPKAREYNNNGLGVLVDVGYCTVTEETNGAFELELQYPVNGSHYSDLAVDCQILAKPNETSDPQAFRIYNISKPMNGVVTVSAEHISYELSSIIVNPFSASNVGDALSKIKSNSIGENPFEFWTDKSTEANMSHNIPLSARSLLGGVSGSVLDTYTGEYEFDNYTVKLHQNRGADNGVVISYAKNLTGVKCDERSDGVITGVIGYWTSEDENGNVETVIGDLQSVSTELSYSRNVVVDFSSEYENKPTKEKINSLAKKYLNLHKNVPYFSVSVEFVNLGDTEEYKQYKGLYRVKLCDIVTVKHPLYGINVKAKVVKTVFDSVREKYDKIEIGEVAAKISQTIVAQEKAISQKVTLSQLDKAILNATNAITGNKGGYVVLNPPTAPQELLILDKPNINEAVNVWRWNLAGLGHSGSGYNGEYSLAILADGAINADFITTGTLDASIIRAGVLSSKNGLSNFSLDTGNAQFGGSGYYTQISSGSIEQYLSAAKYAVGGLVPIGAGDEFSQTLYYVNQSGVKDVSISYKNPSKNNFVKIATFRKSGVLIENYENSVSPFSIRRYVADRGTSIVSLGSASLSGMSSIALTQQNEGSEDYVRFEVAKSNGEAYISIRGASFINGTYNYSNVLELGEDMWWNGDFYCYGNIESKKYIWAPSFGTKDRSFLIEGIDISEDATGKFIVTSGTSTNFTAGTSINFTAGTSICLGKADTVLDGYKVLVSGNLYVDHKIYCSGDISGATITNHSDRKIKKNIKPTKTKNALSSVKSLNIYDYDLKDNGKSVKMGLMADEAPQEILSGDGKGINLYSYCGMLALAVKELSEKVDMIYENGGNNGRKN